MLPTVKVTILGQNKFFDKKDFIELVPLHKASVRFKATSDSKSRV